MSPGRKYFGTDGIRGKVGVDPITPEFAMRLGWAAGRVLATRGRGPVLIGKDTRISGYMFESALEAGLSAAGADIRLLGPLPTPGIAFLTQNTRAQAGIVISASHNPHDDNGFKFFAADGSKLADDLELAIESELERPLQVTGPGSIGKARRIPDAARRYIEFCKSRIRENSNLTGLKLVVDCANGAAYHIAPAVLEELGAQVDAINVTPDGLNINRDCGAVSPRALCARVVERGADAGIALDGDGDRVILVDHKGQVVDGDEILFIIARACAASLNGAVVGTQMSNIGLEQAILALNLGFLRADVGDRHVMEMLNANGLRLGGEASGHIINLNLACTGDGIVAALQVLEAMVQSSRSLHELKQGMRKYPQIRRDIPLRDRWDSRCSPELERAVRDVETELGGNGRILVRPSGTEPLLRVMVEGEDEVRVRHVADALAERVRSALARG